MRVRRPHAARKPAQLRRVKQRAHARRADLRDKGRRLIYSAAKNADAHQGASARVCRPRSAFSPRRAPQYSPYNLYERSSKRLIKT